MSWQQQLERLWQSLLGLGTRRLIALGIVGLTVFAAVGLGSYYLSRPETETLYAGLSPQDVSRIGAVLRESGISFDVSPDGSKVMVAVGQTAQARMLLAEKGLPGSGSAGYELFDKMGSIGLTSFMQEITRTRALEGEIARTIQTMKGVKAARVHIVLPEPGSFRQNRQPPSASVVVRTEFAKDFTAGDAIRQLVAAAVPGMTIDQVRVMSTDGTVLAAGGDPVSAAPARMLELQKTVSKDLQDNIRKTLAPYLGLGNFEISVAARLNLDKRQSNETAFDPESKVERSTRTIKESGSQTNAANKGPVGVDQNIPGDQAGNRSGDESRRSNERKEELTNYELSSKTIQTVSEGYRIENLTVAVVVNKKRLETALGDKPTPEARDVVMKEVERLVGSAAGLDQKRGDRVTVAAVEFFQTAENLEPVSGPGIVELLLQHTGSFVRSGTILLVTLLLIYFGLRPATRVLLEQSEATALAAATTAGATAALPGATGASDGAGDPGALGANGEMPALTDGMREPELNLMAELAARAGLPPQKKLEHVVDFSEEQAAAVLKQWMREAG